MFWFNAHKGWFLAYAALSLKRGDIFHHRVVLLHLSDVPANPLASLGPHPICRVTLEMDVKTKSTPEAPERVDMTLCL